MLGDRPMDSKVQAYQIEAGRFSLTQLIQATGRDAVVVGKLGVVQKGALWRANIFRSGCQQNLLLADNQTRLYQQASLINKLIMWSVNYSFLCRRLRPLLSSALRKLALWLVPQKIKRLILPSGTKFCVEERSALMTARFDRSPTEKKTSHQNRD